MQVRGIGGFKLRVEVELAFKVYLRLGGKQINMTELQYLKFPSLLL